MATRSSIGPATLIVMGAAILLIGAHALLGAWICILYLAGFAFLVDAGCRWLSNTNGAKRDLAKEPEPQAEWFWQPDRPTGGPLFTIVDEEEETE